MMDKKKAKKELAKVKRLLREIDKKPANERILFLDAMLYAKVEGLQRILDIGES